VTKTIPGAIRAKRVVTLFTIGVSLAMAQQPAGTLRVWGDNFEKALGDGLGNNSSVPQSVLGLSNVIGVAAGGFHSIAVKSDGSVWTWGGNDDGQLGIGTYGPSLQGQGVPVPVTGLGPGSGVIAVAAGDRYCLALKADGSVLAWGLNGFKQLGVDGISGSNVPVAVTGLGPGSGVIAIAAGEEFSLALKADGSVLAWGGNTYAELGGGAAVPVSAVPVTVMGLGPGSGAIAIAAGGRHGMTLKSNGAVVAWGDGSFGKLGDGRTDAHGSYPIGVNGLGSGSGVIAIGAGFDHSLAVKSDGSVLAWGRNFYGQVGDAGTTDRSTPVAVSGLGIGSGVTALSAGSGVSLALKADGSMLAWGANVSGQLGDNTTTNRATPVQVVNLNGAVTMALGPMTTHSLVIVQPKVVFSPASLNFGDQLVGTGSVSQMITLQNNGQDPLVVNSISLAGVAAGDFKISAPPMPFTVSPGGSVAISATFTPVAGFARLATLVINDNGFQAPQTVNLTGNGLLQADIAVSVGANPTPVRNRSDLTYTITVKNGGPSSAPSVTVNDPLPAGTVFASGKTTQGTCLAPAPGNTGAVTCNLGTLNNGASATITLVVTVQQSDRLSLVNTVSASAGANDPNLGNNSASVTTAVYGPKQ
jgi:uncharacterized repeat protein (TIGR01451 family)